MVGAVIIGGDFQSLGIVRSLTEKGIPVFIIECEKSISRYSRYVNRVEKNYALLSSSSFAEYLISLAQRENLKGWVLFPTDDECVRLLSIHRDALKDWYRNPVPSWDISEKIYYKKKAYEFADSISIPIPKNYHGLKAEDFLNQDLNFPIVLKPDYKKEYYSKTRKKGLRVDTLEAFNEEFKKMSSIIDPSNIVVQEMILGGPKNLYSYATFFDGEKSVAGMSAIRWRQHPMDFGHATTYAESVFVPELERLSEKLLKAIGYYGLAEVEFMKDDRDGKFKFIEINARTWGWHTLAKAAGVNLPFVLYQSMVYGKQEDFHSEDGVKWIRLLTDIPTVLIEIIKGRMSFMEYLKSFNGKKEFAVWSLKDPLPFLVEILLIPYLWLKRGF